MTPPGPDRREGSRPPDGPPPPAIGIDVVDLRDERCRRRVDDPRFLARILSDSERALLQARPDRFMTLWSLWAAKEAAFKAATALLGAPPVFHHRTFVVEAGGWAGDRSRSVGLQVRHERLTIPVVVFPEEDRLVALAHPGDPDAARWSALALAESPLAATSLEELLSGHLSPRERAGVHSRASALARVHLREDLTRCLGHERSIEILTGGRPGRTPPVAWIDGHPGDVGVTLSHHGRWLAWAWTAHAVRTGA